MTATAPSGVVTFLFTDRFCSPILRVRPLGGRRTRTRCERCNGRLVSVAKDEVIDHLKPLTRRDYDDFSRCAECGRICRPGSHHATLVSLVQGVHHQTPIGRAVVDTARQVIEAFP
jgi:uncharacterized protein with PIN domain